ncbi:two-component regulator propeller domain-containing protein [Sphingomonas sp. DT-51]|uniref:sensor histidine kinase n=1 Tax=Sphingomonas sp. DT-51 TaxID=3396165 RepID=UPI003F1DE658
MPDSTSSKVISPCESTAIPASRARTAPPGGSARNLMPLLSPSALSHVSGGVRQVEDEPTAQAWQPSVMRQAAHFLLTLVMLFGSGHAFALDPQRQLSQYDHRRWMRGDGVPASLSGLAQDRQGFLWMAAADGLYRFDGVRFDRIARIASNGAARRVLITRQGAVWTWFREENLFGVYRRGHLGFVRPAKEEGATGEVISIVQAADDSVWVARGNVGAKLLRFRDGRWRAFTVASGLPREQALALLAARDGSIWVSYIGSILRLRPGASRFETILSFPGLRGQLAQDAAGRIWLSERRGAYVVADGPERHAPSNLALAYHGDDGQRRGPALFDRDGNLWTATRYRGLERLRRPEPFPRKRPAADVFERFTTKDGLSSDSLLAILEDREGNIWVTSSRGLDRFRQVDIVVEPLLTRPAAFGDILHAGQDGSVYVGQSDVIYRVAPGDRPRALLRNVSEPEAICEGGSGALLVVDSKNVYRLLGGRSERLPRPSKAETGIYDCLVDRTGRLWMSAAGSGMYAWEHGGWRRILRQYDPAGFHPTVMIPERGGSVALGWASEVVARVDPPSAPRRLVGEQSGLGDLISLYEGRSGLLVGAAKGLALIADGRVGMVGIDRLPELMRVNGIVQTSAGETWVQGSRGVVRMSTAELERAFSDRTFKPKTRSFGTDEGVPDLYANQSWRSLVQGGDGRIWIATLAGTVWIDPDKVRTDRTSPGAVVTGVRARDGVRMDPVQVTLAKGVSDLEVDYTGLSLGSPQQVRFRYRLMGYDTGWVDAGSRRQAFFTNLRPGTYRFEVLAANGEGVWDSTPATTVIRILPTFAQSRIFYSLCAGAILLICWFAYRFRLARLSSRLDAGLRVRYAERERIARELHDTLLQSAQGLVLRFQAVADRLPAAELERARLGDALRRANAVMSEARDLVRGLRDRNGSADLETLLAEQFARAGFAPEVSVGVTVTGTPRPLRNDVAIELAAIGGEALLNAARHSEASRVEGTLRYAWSTFSLEIRDDGRGIDPGAARGEKDGHFGIVGMRERAERIGGTLGVVAGPDGGTLVRVELPRLRAYALPPMWRRLLTMRDG